MSDGIAVATAVEQAVEQTDALEGVDVRGFARGDDGGFVVEVRAELAGTDADADANGDGEKSPDGGRFGELQRRANTLLRDGDAGTDTRGDGDGESDDSGSETDDFECLNDGCATRWPSAQARNGHMATCEFGRANPDDGEKSQDGGDLTRADYIRANGPCVASRGPDTDAPCTYGAHEAGDPYCPKHRSLADNTAVSHSEVALDAHKAWAHGRDDALESFIDEYVR